MSVIRKGCPFCGGDKMQYLKSNGWEGPLHSVVCLDCFAKGPKEYSKEKAIESWNKRRG